MHDYEKSNIHAALFGFEIVHKYNFLPGARGIRRLPVENRTSQFEGVSALKWVIIYTLCFAIFFVRLSHKLLERI
jgi:hypothetical protein